MSEAYAAPTEDIVKSFRRTLRDEVEFIAVMQFDSIDAIRMFAGEDDEVAEVSPKAGAAPGEPVAMRRGRSMTPVDPARAQCILEVGVRGKSSPQCDGIDERRSDSATDTFGT